MNKNLKSDDLFRGLNPKIQAVQAMSLSAADSQEDRDHHHLMVLLLSNVQ
jgi:hypothetical protein